MKRILVIGSGGAGKVNWQFLKYIWDYPRKRKPAVLEKLESYARTKAVVVLRSGTEIENFIRSQVRMNKSSGSAAGEIISEGDKR